MDSWWSPHQLLLQTIKSASPNMDFMWSPLEVHQKSTRSPLGVHLESTATHGDV